MDIDEPEYTSPGWYPDPLHPGTTRWWDGTEWSDHVQQPEAQLPAAQRGAQTSAARIAGWRRSRYAWLAVSAVVVGVMISFLTGNHRTNQVTAPATQAQAPVVAPAPSTTPLPSGGFDPSQDAAAERTTMEGQLQQLAATLATDRGSSAQFPATLSLDSIRIMTPDGRKIGVVPPGEEFSYNASADRTGYIITLDELANGVGVRFDSATAMLTGY